MSEPEHIIDETIYVFSEKITIDDVDINETYNKCISWIETQDAEFIEEERPNHIKILHKRRYPYRIPIKHIIVDLKDVKNGVDVWFKIPHFDWMWGSKEGQREQWSPIMEEFFRYLGVEIDEISKQLYNEKYWNHHIESNKLFVKLLFLVSVVMFWYFRKNEIILLMLGVGIPVIFLPFYLINKNLIKKRDSLFGRVDD